METTAADSKIASAMAALRELTVRWNWVWLESASNHTAATSAGVHSQSAPRQSMRDTVAA